MELGLYRQYKEKIMPELKAEFGLKNIMQAPRVEKLVINVGYGKHAKDKNYIEHVEKVLTAISGQKPVHNKTKKAISNFKIREGMAVGASVTLRGKKMYNFIYKLVNLALPRIRDFRGLSPKGFDRNANYTFGIKEQLAFPEITAGMTDIIHGLEITLVTSTKKTDEARSLLKKLGFPVREK